MLFYSPHANFQVICSRTLEKRHPVTGDVVETFPAIWANFGKLGPTYEYTDPLTGETAQGAEITGHYYDTDLEAAQNGWDAEVLAMVNRKLVRLCETQPERVRVVEREVARAAVPWPSFDAMEPEVVVERAVELGLVAEALAYERENRARPFVVDALEADGVLAETPTVEPEPVVPAPEPEAVLAGSSRTITV